MCPNCNERSAKTHKTYGVLPCEVCTTARRNVLQPAASVEFTTEEIKKSRKEYKHDIIAPFRQGEVSKEYLDEQKRTNRPHNLNISKEQEENAKNVWAGTTTYYEK